MVNLLHSKSGKILCIVISGLLSTETISAKSNTETIGDILSVAIPAIAYGTTLCLDDEEGETQFYKSYGTTIASTYLLKYTVREQRPDSTDKDSFPSGHTSSAFSGATLIHKRYGLEYAIPAYIGAIYVGYSRVNSNQHYTRDVLAGAALGIASSWYFTTSYKGVEIQPIVGTEYNGVKLSYVF